MFGRNGARQATADAVDTIVPYAEELAEDRKVRERLGSAIGHAAAARQRARNHRGMRGTIMRLSTDRELHAHVAQMLEEVGRLQRRVQKKRSHKLRNTLFVLGGGAAAVAFVPPLRQRFSGLFSEGDSTAGEVRPTTTIQEWIEVEVPVSTAYNQWTQFEDFPLFMDGVDDVRQLDDTRLHWTASIGGRRAEWEAKIVEQVPDTRIVWESLDGKQTRGTVRFEKLADDRTLIHLALNYRPTGLEKLGSIVGIDARRVRGDLERFRELIESRGIESGAWRGEVHSGVKV